VELSGEVIASPPGFYLQDLAGAGDRLFVLTTPKPYGPYGDPPQETGTVLALDPTDRSSGRENLPTHLPV
jgi:hypothetical protein